MEVATDFGSTTGPAVRTGLRFLQASFNLVGGNIYINTLKQTLNVPVAENLKGWAPCVQETGDIAAHKLAVSSLSQLGIGSDPVAKDVNSAVYLDSSNWTGINFNGFKKPEVVVSAIIRDANKAPAFD